MKVGDFVKIDPKYMSPLTAKRYNNSPMGLVVLTWGCDGIWGKVMLLDGKTLTFPSKCVEVIARTENVLDKTSEPDTILPYPGDAV